MLLWLKAWINSPERLGAGDPAQRVVGPVPDERRVEADALPDRVRLSPHHVERIDKVLNVRHLSDRENAPARVASAIASLIVGLGKACI